MWKNVLLQFAKKALYAALGIGAAVLIDFINAGLQHYQPKGGMDDLVWAVIAAGLTGLVAALNRVRTWDPEKGKPKPTP